MKQVQSLRRLKSDWPFLKVESSGHVNESHSQQHVNYQQFQPIRSKYGQQLNYQVQHNGNTDNQQNIASSVKAQHGSTQTNRNWSETLRWWRLKEEIHILDQKIRIIPQWKKLPLRISTELIEPPSKGYSKKKLKAITLATIESKYKEHLHIYTDGSKALDSTSAAIYIPDYDHKEGWKLKDGANISIMGAEMLAISKALEWTALNWEFLEKT